MPSLSIEDVTSSAVAVTTARIARAPSIAVLNAKDDTNTTPKTTTRLIDSDLTVALVFQQQHYHHDFDLTSTSPSFTAKLNNVVIASSNLQYGTFNTVVTLRHGNISNRIICSNRRGIFCCVLLQDQKTLCRLAQNCEAAKKSRLRKKYGFVVISAYHYVHGMMFPLGVFAATGTVWEHAFAVVGNGALAFDMNFMRWINQHHRLISDIRSAVNSQMGDNELNLLIDGVLACPDELLQVKTIGAKEDVFHILSGTWKTHAERCFMWLGGFRRSELLKVIDHPHYCSEK
ncbi:transcription factor TGA2.1 [Arachis duranensis]|uniref:Transcription factor TGA2.1 n=1 Tax=Arachis duranensis TaxID=130453 RepID=A0A9C6TWX4_ARADU|nr:transcription factor TGA2.1 [Arachis duranensis]